MDLGPRWSVYDTRELFFRYVPLAFGFLLGFPSFKYECSACWKFHKRERHTYLKKRFDVERSSQKILFPYTTERKR